MPNSFYPGTTRLLPEVYLDGKWVYYKERQSVREYNCPGNPDWKELGRGCFLIRIQGILQPLNTDQPFVYYG